jgi:hypothetical protein
MGGGEQQPRWSGSGSCEQRSGKTSGNIITKRQFITFVFFHGEDKKIRRHTFSVCLSKGTQKHSKWYVVVVCGFRIRSRVRNWVRVIG